MDLNTLLGENKIATKDVLVMRHRPHERNLREILPWLAEERPQLFNAYQSSHHERQESAMARAKYLASLIGHEPGKALFVGLYAVGQNRLVSADEFWGMQPNQELQKLGMATRRPAAETDPASPVGVEKKIGSRACGSISRRPRFVRIGKASSSWTGRVVSVAGVDGLIVMSFQFKPSLRKAYSFRGCRRGTSSSYPGTNLGFSRLRGSQSCRNGEGST